MKRSLLIIVALLVAFSMILAACGATDEPAPEPTEAPAVEPTKADEPAVDLPEVDFPVMPGRIVRVRGGAEIAFANGRPSVVVKGVSLMGVPVPNAWLGNLKNVDLVSEFGDAGFWKAFADGVQSVSVREGRLHVELKE